jgi:hypothetical protein
MDGITTEIIYNQPVYSVLKTEYSNVPQSVAKIKLTNDQINYYSTTEKPKRKDYKEKEQYLTALNHYLNICDSLDNMIIRKLPINLILQNDDLIVGRKFVGSDGDSAYLHKKEVVRRRVSGHEGYCGTLIWEDDYELCITDNYAARDADGVEYTWKVRYKCDKNGKLGFEDLEGRRFYLRGVIDQFIATWSFDNIVKYNYNNDYPKRKNYNSSLDYGNAVDLWFENKNKSN